VVRSSEGEFISKRGLRWAEEQVLWCLRRVGHLAFRG